MAKRIAENAEALNVASGVREGDDKTTRRELYRGDTYEKGVEDEKKSMTLGVRHKLAYIRREGAAWYYDRGPSWWQGGTKG